MKRLMPWALPIALLSSYQAQAGDSCSWSAGTQPMTITRTLPGVMHVPLNAEPGSAIGTPKQWDFTASQPMSELHCYNDGTVLWRFDMNARDIFPDPLPPVEGEPSDGYILKTNIDGVGARIRLRAPFNGSDPAYFMPENGPHDPFIPVRTSMQTNLDLGGFKLSRLWNEVTLVKTGDIAPGLHKVDTELFTGHFDATGLGLVLRYRLQADVLQTQCSLIGDPISDTPVDLQTWDKSHFVGKGTTTSTVPFSITLSNCRTDPGGMTRATIELDPANSSTPVPGLDGVFTLTPDSSAEGVGIQVLKEDGSPLPLQREEDLQAIQDGTTVLNFGARFYQTEDASAVRAGEANGALNFTLRYR
ncbi:fimbrial protein [Pseudomonas monteilii]|uniref:fimbrial protein n=1 Tax=Pseudomonas monteilii TaxID=76759 RepID=UPI0038278A64